MKRIWYSSLFKIYKKEFLDISVSKGLITPEAIVLAGDGTPVVTSHKEREKRICDCVEKDITDCKCNRYFSQPDCDIGWDSSRDCYYHGYDLYMLVAADSESDLPIFPHFSCASKHDSHGFLHTFFRFKRMEYNARTSVERSNKREKLDFKLEDGRHRSTKMWYCHLYHILMLQHLVAWDLPFESHLNFITKTYII